jgi:2-isopropylmalate synthase
VREKAAEFGVELDQAAVDRALERLKVLEHRGYAFEAADASFELLLRTEAGDVEPLFSLEALRVITEKRADGRVETEATIKLRVRGERVVQTAEGNGPVNALDSALRSAVAEQFPELNEVELVDYKVRILAGSAGTDSITRVLVSSARGAQEWTTVGVHANVVEASWQALVDALVYALGPAAPEVNGADAISDSGVTAKV